MTKKILLATLFLMLASPSWGQVARIVPGVDSAQVATWEFLNTGDVYLLGWGMQAHGDTAKPNIVQIYADSLWDLMDSSTAGLGVVVDTLTEIVDAEFNQYVENRDSDTYPGDSVSTVYTMLTDTTWDMKNGFVWAGAHEFTGGTPSLEIPNADNPTTDAEGEIAWDTNDDAIEVYMGDETESALIPAYQKIDALIFAPDGVNDEIAIFHVDALVYPFGIEVDQVSITLPADAAYAMPFEEWADDPPVWQALIDSVVTTGTDSYMEDGAPVDGAIDADDYIYLDIPATDVDWIHVQVIFHITQGN